MAKELPKAPLTELIDFFIQDLDSLGQGVSKQNGKVTFIEKVLPNETGKAKIYAAKKGVQFAELSLLDQENQSSDRISAKCEHFNLCNGCQYQHVEYDFELRQKSKTLENELLRNKLIPKSIQFRGAKSRFEYRNRVQLHYDLKKSQFGFRNHKGDIVEIQRCLLAHPLISALLAELLENENWKRFADSKVLKGHIELSLSKEEKVQISANRPYSDGGFRQVNQEMASELASIVTSEIDHSSNKDCLLELFAGDGNLSQHVKFDKTYLFDIYSKRPESTDNRMFYSLNLFQKDALKKLQQTVKHHVDCLLLDPPRSGFKELREAVATFSPKKIIYVSCAFQTMIRDLKLLENYSLDSVFLVDMFPSTKHFETVAVLTKTH